MAFQIGTWAVDIHPWDPSQAQWKSLVDLLDLESQKDVASYRHMIDSKRCLVGKLLVRALLFELYGLDPTSLEFSRTKLGRPYMSRQLPNHRYFDYNISHDSDLVVCGFIATFEASPALQRIGVDVMQLKLPRGEQSVATFAEMLSESLTSAEVKLIRQPSPVPSDLTADEVLLDRLLQLWTLKESVVKAMGVGLSRELSTIDFLAIPPSDQSFFVYSPPARKEMEQQPDIKFTVDGQAREGWSIWTTILHLPRETAYDRYVLSIAGELENGTDSDGSCVHSVDFKSIEELVKASLKS
ncbi:4'-phosphopantetheinyl transferase superfamily [Melampsora americana]|nr:4'-phosphopantetheinyl transferase superfamily [Melampsora americana]